MPAIISRDSLDAASLAQWFAQFNIGLSKTAY
jgi:hypothetical protein